MEGTVTAKALMPYRPASEERRKTSGSEKVSRSENEPTLFRIKLIKSTPLGNRNHSLYLLWNILTQGRASSMIG
jgi:hypothetical protein